MGCGSSNDPSCAPKTDVGTTDVQTEHVVFEHLPTIVLDGAGKPSAPKLGSSGLPGKNDPYSVTVWVKLIGTSGLIAHWGGADDFGSAIGLHVDSPTVINHFWWGDDLRASGLCLNDQNWHHIAATYDGNERNLYVDFERVAHDQPTTWYSLPCTDNLKVGFLDSKAFGENQLRFQGEIKELRVWDCALRYHGTEEHTIAIPPLPRLIATEDPLNCAEGVNETEEDIRLRCSGLIEQYVELPEHFEKPQGFIMTLLETGAIALVKGSYLIELADRGQPIPRRQDAPPEAFWSRQEAVALFRRSATEFKKKGPDIAGLLCLGLFLVAFSYPWCDPKHPDPACFHLYRIAEILRGMARLRGPYNTFDDVGVFFDYLSIFQCPPSGKRTGAEQALFHLALYGMNFVYCHDLALVIKLKKMPPPPQPLNADGFYPVDIRGVTKELGWDYEKRGWPIFEQTISDSRMAVQWSRLEFKDDDVSFNSIHEIRYKFLSRGAACHPDRFAKMLAATSFTNGSDKDVVLELYRKTFKSIAQTKTQTFCTIKWSEKMCEQYSEALLAFEELESLTLVDGRLGQEEKGAMGHCLRMLTEPLATKEKLSGFTYLAMAANDADVCIICESLPACLVYLGLGENCITDSGAKTLSKELPTKTPNLKVLNFAGNYPGRNLFTDAGKSMLQKALPQVQISF